MKQVLNIVFISLLIINMLAWTSTNTTSDIVLLIHFVLTIIFAIILIAINKTEFESLSENFFDEN